MLEDKLLIWKLRQGNKEALRSIYGKYKNDLLALAVSLSNDRAMAEDVVHDVFVSFAMIAGRLKLRTSLKSYLASCVVNRIRNLVRSRHEDTVEMDAANVAISGSAGPAEAAMSSEESERIGGAIALLPYEQREVILLHLQTALTFRAIAESLGISTNTVQARYRYGLEKLKLTLNGEIQR